MLPKISKTPSPTNRRILSSKDYLTNSKFDIVQETIELALNVLNLDKRSYNVLDYDDLKHYKVTDEITTRALAILLFYKIHS